MMILHSVREHFMILFPSHLVLHTPLLSSGVTKMINEGSLLACYPLHDGDLQTEGSQRKLLYEEWASVSKFWKYQPLDAIRDYYGVKMGLYFAWLGIAW